MGACVVVREGHCRSGSDTGGKGRYFWEGTNDMETEKLKLERIAPLTRRGSAGTGNWGRHHGRRGGLRQRAASPSRSRLVRRFALSVAGCMTEAMLHARTPLSSETYKRGQFQRVDATA